MKLLCPFVHKFSTADTSVSKNHIAILLFLTKKIKEFVPERRKNGKYIKDSGKSSKIPDIMSERKLVSGYRRLMNLRKYRMIVRNIIRGCTYNVIIRLFLRGIIRSRSESSWMNAI